LEARLAAAGLDGGADPVENDAARPAKVESPRAASEGNGKAPVAVFKNGANAPQSERPDDPPHAELDTVVARIPESVRRELDELFRAKFIALRNPPARADDT